MEESSEGRWENTGGQGSRIYFGSQLSGHWQRTLVELIERYALSGVWDEKWSRGRKGRVRAAGREHGCLELRA
jgi:hypothetical protein